MQTYGTEDRSRAEALARYLATLNEVQQHDRRERLWTVRAGGRTVGRDTWGVLAYEPYIENHMRCLRFVWHDYTKPLPGYGLTNPRRASQRRLWAGREVRGTDEPTTSTDA
jgi:hypothetical protein